MENKILISQRRIFKAKAAWNISQPEVIGEIEEVVKTILNTSIFKNGIEYIKELQGDKFIRASKKDIQALLSHSKEDISLCEALFKKY